MALLLTLRSLSSAIAISGSAILAMGTGLIDVDPGLWNCARHVIGDSVPQRPFLIVLGTAKILGALSLWKIGPFAKIPALSLSAICIPPMCAVYGHIKAEDGKAVGALIYLALFGLYSVLDNKDNKSKLN